MQYLERKFKSRVFTLILFVVICTAFLGIIVQEVNEKMGGILTSLGVCSSDGCILLFDIGIIVFLFAISYFWLDGLIYKKMYAVNLEWAVINDKYARVEVMNIDEDALEDCVGKLVGKIQKPTALGLPRINETSYKFFSWSKEKKDRQGSRYKTNIDYGLSGKLDVAIAKNGELYFTFANNPMVIGSEKGEYKFSIQITGKKDGMRFESIIKKCIIDFQGTSAKIKFE